MFDRVKYNSAKYYSRIMEGKSHYVAKAANFQLTKISESCWIE